MNILERHKTNIAKKYIYIAVVLFSIAVVIQVTGAEQNPDTILFLRRLVLFGSVYAIWAKLLDYINALIKPFEDNTSVLIQIIGRVISASLLVLFNLFLSNIIYYATLIIFKDISINEVYADFEPYIVKSIVIRYIDLIIIGLILKLITANQNLQKQKLKVVSLENQLHMSQLETLKSQLDPHFLFNTLHTLNTLIGYDDKKAQSMVIKVTNLLRKILDKREKQLSKFNEEVEYFKNHLEIEEERFHDRLEVFIDIEDETRDLMVPTLMLQPLIENAFKHGIAQLEGKGIIKLKAYIKDGVFTVCVFNNIPKDKLSNVVNSTKLGLQNLDSRLEKVYGLDYKLTTRKDEDSFMVIVRIQHK